VLPVSDIRGASWNGVVKLDSRINFAIEYYADPILADERSQQLRSVDARVRSGWSEGALCGRARECDLDPDPARPEGQRGPLYAVRIP
jgi:hypothetical protein